MKPFWNTARYLLLVNAVIIQAQAEPLSLTRIAQGFSSPLYATAPANDGSRLFVVEKDSGQIKILNPVTGTVNTTPFLTVQNISNNSERGLLGLAFHPQYSSNRRFYVNLTNTDGNTEIHEYQASSNPDIANPATKRIIMQYDQPQSNHNGGWLGFGKDGYLYIASGDGGGSNDPDDNGQSLHSLLGKMLRIDVNEDDFPADANRNYGIPDDNPFVGVVIETLPASEEIWAYGLRNPWRSSFDRQRGDLIIADVGQGSREEINFQLFSSIGGENYGWRLREGTIQTPSSDAGGPRPADNVEPVYDYAHGFGPFQGNSVTGGYVYRGPVLAARGKYFFGDFETGGLWSLIVGEQNAGQLTDWTSQLIPDKGALNNISSFGEDAVGNLYIVDFDGEIFKFTGDTSNGGGGTVPSTPGIARPPPGIYLLLEN